MSSEQPEPWVKSFAALLHARETGLAPCLALLEEAFSSIDYRGAAHEFRHTGYYEEEMGADLVRTIVAFGQLQPASFLVDAKHRTNDMEAATALDGKRRFNIDIGYLDLHKVVLASFKGRGTKIYLARGVWGDMIMQFADGAFRPLPWCFPDFREGRYDQDLLPMRQQLKAQLKPRA